MKISEALVFGLKALNTRYVFGVSGANIEHLHDAIKRSSDGELEAVLSKCENGAAFMADAHARVHRTLGVCCSTSGGGMFNLLPGLGEAFAESVPVLAIIGQPPRMLEGRGAFQDSSDWGTGAPNAIDLLKSTTKWTHKIERASDFWVAFLEGVRHALSGRQGPVALLIPRDLFDEEVEDLEPAIIRKLLSEVEAPSVNDKDLDSIFKAIRFAQHPTLVIGQGVARSHTPSFAAQFALRTNIPTVTTLSARALMPNDAENYLGLVGAAGHPSVHEYLIQKTDLIVAAGTGLSVMSRGPLGTQLKDKGIISVNVHDEAILRVAPHAKIIHADAGAFFRSMIDDERINELNFANIDYQKNVLKPLDAPYEVSDKSNHSQLRQSEAIALVETIFPKNGHVLFDAGNCAAAALHWTHSPAGSSSTIALGMGTMGYAVGGAIGAQFGSPPGTRTVSIVGDGAFLMSGMEIHTAIEHQLPILYVVFNNNAHGMCVTRQHLFFEDRRQCSTYHEFSAAQAVKALAGNLPCFIASASTFEELENALDNYRNHAEIPGIIEIKNYKEEWPPFAPFFKEVGPTLVSRSSLMETIGIKSRIK